VPAVAADAFGLPVRLPNGLLAEALRPATAGELRPPTVVTIEPNAIDPWEPGTTERLREQRHEDRVIWSIDVDPDRGFLMDAPSFATMVVTHDGLAIRCTPSSPTGDKAWSSLITSQALPLAATLRHLEVLHASAVTVDGRALVFCAGPGTGKSSLAVQLVLRGAGLLSDDAVAIDDKLVAHPSTGAVHLRAAALSQLGAEARARLGIGTATRLDGRAVGSVKPAAPKPLGAVFLLQRAPYGSTIEAIEAVDPVLLLGSTFTLSMRSPERLLRHLDLCAQIAARVPVFLVRITPDIDAAALADRVLACR
jgi:hypothetical protein